MTTMKQKIVMYESFLHQLQRNSMVTMNGKNVEKLINNACSWSYAHRIGNGELSDKEQREAVERAFNKLTDIYYSDVV